MLEDDALRLLHEFLNIVSLAIEQSDISKRGVKFGSGSGEGMGWLGWNIDALNYFFYVRVSHPDTVVLQTYNIDKSKYDNSHGRVYKDGKAWSWDAELDLVAQDTDFYS